MLELHQIGGEDEIARLTVGKEPADLSDASSAFSKSEELTLETHIGLVSVPPVTSLIASLFRSGASRVRCWALPVALMCSTRAGVAQPASRTTASEKVRREIRSKPLQVMAESLNSNGVRPRER